MKKENKNIQDKKLSDVELDKINGSGSEKEFKKIGNGKN